jgi:anthranilate phosphoribosyltransferase
VSEITKYIEKIATHQSLSVEEASRAFQIIMLGGATPAQMAALLMGLKMKGESIEEITGAALVLRSRSGKIDAPDSAMDTCGTGGDRSGILNVSTAVALVVAACGIPVAKHGNRAISSRSGSADVLAELGVNIDAEEALIEESLREAGLCFMMAPKFHTAMRHVGSVRIELEMRTIFNLLGPLCNPAQIVYQLLGVYDRRWLVPMANVLRQLGTRRAWVVHGGDGLDELTTTTTSYVAALYEDGRIEEFSVDPVSLGLEKASLESLAGGEASYNARRLLGLLKGERNPYRDIVLLNSAAALVVAGKAHQLIDGLYSAAEAIDSGRARAVLEKLVEITNKSHVS